MSSINKRQLLIIKHLINAKDTLSSDVLASVLGITPKTVRNDIELINLLLERVGARIVSKLGSGYYIDISIHNEFYIFLQSFNEKYIDNSTIPNLNFERLKYIIHNLLILDDFIKSDVFIDELYISRSTLTNDLNQIRLILRNYHLELIHKPNYGVYIEGLESNKRIALCDYINIDEDLTFNELSNFKLFVDQKSIEDSLTQKLLYSGVSISLKSLKEITALIQITITRGMQGKKIVFTDNQIESTKNTVEHTIVSSIFNELNYDLPILDQLFISVYLISRRIYGVVDDFNLYINKDLYFLSDEMLRFLFLHTNLDFSYDQEVRQLLSRELKSMLIRLEYKIELRNLPIIETKQENSAFEYALIMIDYLSKKYNLKVPEEEAIPLALILQKSLLNDYRNIEKLKVGLVFYKGKNYSYLIENKLNKHFNNHLKKIELLEYYELCPSYEDQYDLIITDLPITRFNINIPIFQVQNQLNEYERKKLSQFFTRKNLKLGWFLEALNPKLFLSDCNVSTKEELIKIVSELFIKNVKVSDQIFDLFTYRESLSVSEHGNNCALIHTMYQCSEKTQISFIKLRKPIIWHNESVQLVFFIANGNEERLYNFIDWLRQMLNQMNLVHELLKCKEYSQVSEVFINVFHKLDLN